jgi:N-acetylglucosamine malate deacetylase 1
MNVLIVAAHPDDEVAGAGCAIAKHVRAGDKVTAMFLTDGVSARPGWSDSERSARRRSAEKAASILGYSDLRFYDFPDNALDSVPLLEIARAVEKVAADVDPDIVYSHHAGDLNVDHKLALRASLTCFRPLPGARVQRILSFEVPSATGWDFGPAFVPNVFVAAEDVLTLKLDALDAYEAEVRPFPHARSRGSLEARAKAWGTQVGLAAAEPFVLLREIVR